MTTESGPSRAFLLAAFAASGAAALTYEVVWTRALSLVLGSTTHAVSVMLATFMGGLAAGAVWGGRYADRGRSPVRAFAWCELGIGVTGILSVPLIYRLPAGYLALYRAAHLSPALFFAGQVLLCALVMLVPTVLMGATFPLVARALIEQMDTAGRRVASAYAINTVGAMAGSLFAGFALIPALGLKGAALAAGGLNLLVGVVLLVRARVLSRAGLLVVLALYGTSGMVAMGAHRDSSLVNFYSAHRHMDAEPYRAIARRDAAVLTALYEKDTAQGTVRAFRNREGHLLLHVAGKIEGTTARDRENTLLLAYLPLATHPAPRTMLVVGLGAGVTLEAARRHLDAVDLCEINPGVLEAVRRHGPEGLLDGVRVFQDDARNLLLRSGERWDLITSEPSYPTDAGVANLFTVEYYRLAARRLSPGGLYCQWLPYHLLTNADVDMMVRTFLEVFPHAMLWKVPGSLDLILVGGLRALTVPPDAVQTRVRKLNGEQWPLTYVLSRGPEALTKMAEDLSIPVNTDDRPRLEFRVARNLRIGDLALLEPTAGSLPNQ